VNRFVQNIDFGDLPTWLAAIGAFIAAVFAFGQLKALRRQNRLQQSQLNSQAADLDRLRETQRKQAELLDLDIRDRRASQARRVEVRQDVVPWQDPGSGVKNGFARILRVTNHSPGSINSVDGFFELPGYPKRRATFSAAPQVTQRGTVQSVPGDRPEVDAVPITRLEPNETIDLIGPMHSEDNARDTHAELFFTDSDVRRWKIDHKGQLTEVIEDIS
jgi:hypothetical protein